ncbi:MAG: HlyD family secretion protein [Pseudomonadales bacterium]|nr:HlyD family secretion protein [Pseudomonadales bacterium]
MSTEPTDKEVTEAPSGKNKNLIILVLTVAILVASVYWGYQRYTHVYISDARISTSMISVGSRVPGWIAEFDVSSNDRLKKGQPIIKIDSRDAQLRLKELDAQVAAMEAELDRLTAQKKMVDLQTGSQQTAASSRLSEAQSELTSSQVKLDFASHDLERATKLRDKNLIAQHQWDSKKSTFDQAKQSHAGWKAKINTAQAAVSESQANRDQMIVLESQQLKMSHQLQQIKASRERQALKVADHTIPSPISGVVDETFVDAGEYIGPGQRILLMHNPDNIWIKANAKETEIRFIEVGTPAVIIVDAYPDLELVGEVSRIGSSATSQFSLLPNANPSGNFTKITQRIPIWISFSKKDPRLRPGMMVEVALEIR